MNKKRLAVLCFDNLERPENGYAIRSWMIAEDFKRQGYDVAVFQFAYVNKQTIRDGIPIFSLKVSHQKPQKGLLERTFSFNPFKELFFPLEGYFRLRRFRDQLQQFDEFCIEGCLLLNAFWFAKSLKKPIILDTHLINKDSAIKMRQKSKIVGNARVLIWHLIEKTVLTRVDEVIAISDYDKNFLEEHYHIPPDRISIIAHRVEPADAARHKEEARQLRAKLIKQHKKIACFIGDLGAIQNIDAEKFIRDQLAPVTREVHYVLVGNNPRQLPSKGNVTYTGFVDAVDPYVLMSDFCIAPLSLGGGVKTKVLDYFKYQKPVIATSIATEGLEPTPETQICNLDEFAASIRAL